MDDINLFPANLPCPGCGKSIAMPTHWVEGMRMNCPKCGEEITEDLLNAIRLEIFQKKSEALKELRKGNRKRY